ncbi:hypothetical protein CKO09_01010 [Chromatium weissei]|nr:hypothetical protein [Chromatium weissei]
MKTEIIGNHKIGGSASNLKTIIKKFRFVYDDFLNLNLSTTIIYNGDNPVSASPRETSSATTHRHNKNSASTEFFYGYNQSDL